MQFDSDHNPQAELPHMFIFVIFFYLIILYNSSERNFNGLNTILGVFFDGLNGILVGFSFYEFFV